MTLLPPTTNDCYRGSPLAIVGLGLFAALTLIPACIHMFLPDGGAGVIAGLDLSGDRATIVGLFAWAGTTQFVWGLMMLAVLLRYRSLVPLVLALIVVERMLHAINMWVFKPIADRKSVV